MPSSSSGPGAAAAHLQGDALRPRRLPVTVRPMQVRRPPFRIRYPSRLRWGARRAAATGPRVGEARHERSHAGPSISPASRSPRRPPAARTPLCTCSYAQPHAVRHCWSNQGHAQRRGSCCSSGGRWHLRGCLRGGCCVRPPSPGLGVPPCPVLERGNRLREAKVRQVTLTHQRRGGEESGKSGQPFSCRFTYCRAVPKKVFWLHVPVHNTELSARTQCLQEVSHVASNVRKRRCCDEFAKGQGTDAGHNGYKTAVRINARLWYEANEREDVACAAD